jgi:hypothetical protein
MERASPQLESLLATAARRVVMRFVVRPTRFTALINLEAARALNPHFG